MRRTDREVQDLQEIFAMLEKCTTISLGMNDQEYPYVIPMTFGCALEDTSPEGPKNIVIYFHSAQAGHKWELLEKDNNVCIEAHMYYRTEEVPGGAITAKYESVIGFGKAERLTDPKAKIAGIKTILEHYNHSGFPATSCKGMSKCEVFRVVLENVTGKHNL